MPMFFLFILLLALPCAGVKTSASYVCNVLGNPVGGKQKGCAYTDSWDADLTHEWNHFTFYTNCGFRNGSNLANKIGCAFPPSQLYGYETIWLDNFYLEKRIDNYRLRFGRIQAGDSFLQSPLYCYFISNAFCSNPIAVFFNGVFSANPIAQWGVYSDYQLSERLLIKGGVFNTNRQAAETKYHGMNLSFKNLYGAQLITEIAYATEKGNYKIGYLYYTGGCRQGNFNAYLNQVIWKCEERTLTPFIALLFAPNNQNTFPFFCCSGVVGKGLIATRKQDVTSLGMASGSYSSSFKKQSFEMVVELNHQFRITPSFYIQPDIQYIIHPKGYSDIQNALVAGAQMGITF